MAEKYYHLSPYEYCGNNPVNRTDIDGRKIVFANSVSESFKKDYNLAVQYLNHHGVGDMLQKLDASPTVYYISESVVGRNYFDTDTRIISWDSRMGIETNELHLLSPATLLNHEIDHALEFDNSPSIFKENKKVYNEGDPDEFYYSPEEKRVITGSEQRTAKALGEIKEGEVTRTDHYGNHVKMISPVSNEPVEMKPEVIIIPTR